MSELNQSQENISDNQTSKLSNFEKVYEFNKLFGIHTQDTPFQNIFTENPDLLKYRLSLIEEECKELQDASRENNFTEIVDALSDILYVVYGMGVSLGVDLDKSFNIVHDSNMSKMCKTEDEAQRTVEWYKENMLVLYKDPQYRKSDDGKHWVVYNAETGKILKSILYTPANFTEMLKN